MMLGSIVRRQVHALAVAGLLIAVAVAYGPTLEYGFVWDDHVLIEHNEKVREAAHWESFFLESFWRIGEHSDDPSRSFYRPLVSFSYAVDYAAWGLNPAGYHLTNILLHLACCLLVYLLGLRLGLRPALALLAGLLFALHPSHVENVAWISGRTDVICGLFYFLAFYAFLAWQDRPARRDLPLLVLLLFALACLSKEMAITLPILIAVYGVAVVPRGRRRPAVALVLGLVLIAVAYLGLRFLVLGRLTGPSWYGDSVLKAWSVVMVSAKYLALLANVVLPDPHHAEGLVRSAWQPLNFLYLAADAGVAALVVACFRHGWRQVAFWLAWTGLTLLPVLNLGTFGDILYADRFLYIPSLGLALGLPLLGAAILRELGPRYRLLKPALVASAVMYGLALFLTLAVTRGWWRDDVTLFGRAARTSPQSSYIWFNYGLGLANVGLHAEALQAYGQAMCLQPKDSRTYIYVGYSLEQLGRYREALTALNRAQALGAGNALFYSMLARMYIRAGRWTDARDAYLKSLEIKSSALTLAKLGESLMMAGSDDLAIRQYAAALAIKPAASAYHNLGILWLRRENYRAAMVCFNRALYMSDHLTPVQQAILVRNWVTACYLGNPEVYPRPALWYLLDLN